MRYLRKFKESIGNDFYRKVNIDEYRKYINFSNIENIDKKITDLILKFNHMDIINDKKNHLSFNTDKIGCDIQVFSDEWIGVSFVFFGKNKQEYYICDQFEGLFRLLSDIGLVKSLNESKIDKPNIKKIEIDGFLIIYGKDAKSNDYVTLELSNEEDYWMHAKGVPGSHVIIKVKDKLPTSDIIRKAAIIAAKNSKSKEDEVLIVYCKKKFVKKERSMNVGQVSVDYKNAYEIKVPKK